MSVKIPAQIRKESLSELVSKFDDLSKIGDIVKVKIDKEHTLMYSMVGDTVMLAFKSYLIPTQDYLDMTYDGPMINWIISGSKKFVKNLNFLKTDNRIDVTIDSKEEEDSLTVRSIAIKNGKLKIQSQSGENTEIRDITRNALDQRLDMKNQKWEFHLSSSDFADVKKLSSINSDGRVIHLNVEGGKVMLSEPSTWEIEVSETNTTDKHLIFNKSFLGSIVDEGDGVVFHIFETFILIKTKDSNLLISFEQDFAD